MRCSTQLLQSEIPSSPKDSRCVEDVNLRRVSNSRLSVSDSSKARHNGSLRASFNERRITSSKSSSSLEIVCSDFCFATSTSSSSDFMITSNLSMSSRDFSLASSTSCSSDFGIGSANDFFNASPMSSSSDFFTGSANDAANEILTIFCSSALRTSCLRYSSSKVCLLTLTAYAKASSSMSVSVSEGFRVSLNDASIPDCKLSIC
mmetsp:Transcript_7428/g.10832  ORF Transcript_7428/g.10832 Transcript_7428/m.10832 type:complete len:205 (-) Transcript_7428:99-713(-)